MSAAAETGIAGPVLLVGAGALGSALLEGWRRTGALDFRDLMIVEPNPGGVCSEALAGGARLNPPADELRRAKTVLVAVKPQQWRAAAVVLAHGLDEEAVVVSVMAGVPTEQLREHFEGRRIARVMPTTGVAAATGPAAIYAADPAARAAARALFERVATVVELEDEKMMDAVTAVGGSGPAYLYAFVVALEQAGVKAGLPPQTARDLARATVVGAAGYLAASGKDPEDLIAKVASPGGTTEAALKVLRGEASLDGLVNRTVQAACRRAAELGR